MNTKQEKIIRYFNNLIIYSAFLGGIVMFILPIIFNFINIPMWKVNFLSIVFLSFVFSLMSISITISLFLTWDSFKKITSGPKKLQNLSPQKARNLRNVLSIVAIIIFIGITYMFLPYSIKGINYLYIQHKKPITQTDLVVKARAGTGTSKFTVQNVEFQNLGKLEMWFEAKRFEEGKYYEITRIPGTKYVLDRKRIEE